LSLGKAKIEKLSFGAVHPPFYFTTKERTKKESPRQTREFVSSNWGLLCSKKYTKQAVRNATPLSNKGNRATLVPGIVKLLHHRKEEVNQWGSGGPLKHPCKRGKSLKLLHPPMQASCHPVGYDCTIFSHLLPHGQLDRSVGCVSAIRQVRMCVAARYCEQREREMVQQWMSRHGNAALNRGRGKGCNNGWIITAMQH